MLNMNQFILSLKENGIHSLKRGLKTLVSFEEERNKFDLKEAIIFIHHGIELLLKQVLVENFGEHLIFADINDRTIKKLIEAKSTGKNVFDLSSPVNTSTFRQAIQRIKAFSPAEQNFPLELEHLLEKLNGIRNSIEHYGINKSTLEIEEILINLRGPILDFLSDSIKDFKVSYGEEINTVWSLTEESIKNYSTFEEEVSGELKKIQGKTYNGQLFGRNSMISIPTFVNLNREYQIRKKGIVHIIDIYGKVESGNDWIIQLKTSIMNHDSFLQILRYFENNFEHKTPKWLIVKQKLTKNQKEAGKLSNTYITGIEEWERLKQSILKK